MFIKLSSATTPPQAIKMAYEFAGALRATGWPPEDIEYARALWIGAEYTGNALLACLDAGFSAGYLGDSIPAAKDVMAANPAMPGSPEGEEIEGVPLDQAAPNRAGVRAGLRR